MIDIPDDIFGSEPMVIQCPVCEEDHVCKSKEEVLERMAHLQAGIDYLVEQLYIRAKANIDGKR